MSLDDDRERARCDRSRRPTRRSRRRRRQLADELLALGEAILESWLAAHGETPTTRTVEGFRLLALHRQGARGDPSFNACRETCRELVYHRQSRAPRAGACRRRSQAAPRRHGGAASGAFHRRQARSGRARRVLLLVAAAAPARSIGAARREPSETEDIDANRPRLQPSRRSSLRRREQHLVSRERRRHRDPRHDGRRRGDGRPARRLHRRRRPAARWTRGKSCATIESGKWVGPAKIAFDAEVVEVNDALTADPKLANADPYGEGWMVKVRPKDWAAAKATPHSRHRGRRAL